MLPYRDSFKCERGKDEGVCNSVVEVYELSNDRDTLRLKASGDKTNIKEKGEVISTKPLLEQSDEKGLREIANSMSIKQIQNSKPVIFNINGDSFNYEIPNNQQVLEYLIKDKNAYNKRLSKEINNASNEDLLKILQDTNNKDKE